MAHHERGIEAQQQRRDDGEAARGSDQEDGAGDEVADADALQHAGNADVGEVELGNEVEQQSQAEDERSTAEGVQIQLAAIGALFNPSSEGERHRDADHPEEEGENEVGEGPAVPDGVAQGREDMAPGARIVHHHHGGDRQTA